ncbi:MAG: hypothetical protein E7162_06295 [Firmicutes bacterium]|nr:hypothetical protein [Bacillota bacterium]
MNKKILFLITLMFLILPMHIKAAKIQTGDVSLECVYENGITAEIYYDGTTYGVDIDDFNLARAITPPYQTSNIVVYNEATAAKNALKAVSCPSTIHYMVTNQWDDDGNSLQYIVYTLNQSDMNSWIEGLNDDTKGKEDYFGFSATGAGSKAFLIRNDTPLSKRLGIWGRDGKRTDFKFYLVAERINFDNYVEPNLQWAFKSEGAQAASTPEYFMVSNYTKDDGSTFNVAEKDGETTNFNMSFATSAEENKRGVCFQASQKLTETEKNSIKFKFTRKNHTSSSATRFGLETTDEYIRNYMDCPTGYTLYISINLDDYPVQQKKGTSICEVIPETAVWIALIIKYLQFLVPILLIVLTGLDISKMVLAGDIEEELPKKKKLILARFIVAVVFFFVPLIIGLVINDQYGTDFGDVSCLWNQDTTAAEEEIRDKAEERQDN